MSSSKKQVYIVRLQKGEEKRQTEQCKKDGEANLPVLADKVLVADSFFSRLKGLMFKKGLADGEGLLLTKTKQIHTCWMRFTIDVFYLKKTDQHTYMVVGLDPNMKPWKFGRLYREATHVLELNKGIIDNYSINIGDQLKISKILMK